MVYRRQLYPIWDCWDFVTNSHIHSFHCHNLFVFLATRFITPLSSGLCLCKNKCLHLSNICQRPSILHVFAVATSNRVLRSWKLTCLQRAEFRSREIPNWIQWCDWIVSEFYDCVIYWMSTYSNSTGLVWLVFYFVACGQYKPVR